MTTTDHLPFAPRPAAEAAHAGTRPAKVGRVLHVVVPEPAGEIGGADMHVLELAAAQKSRSAWEPLVLATENPEYAERLEGAGVEHVPGHHAANYPALLRMAARVAGGHRLSLIHSHGYDCDYLTFLLRLLHPFTWGRIPTVITCHGWIEDSWYHRLKTWADFQIYRTAQALIVCSPQNLQRLERFGARALTRYIPNGIQFPGPQAESGTGPGLRERFRLPAGARLVAAVGRLSPEKRFDIYLAACREVAAAVGDVHFLVVGAGPERARLEALTEEYGIGRRVTFTGLAFDINSVYRELSLLVLSSDTEGTPRVIIEAMAHALPVVATRVGGVDQLVRHGVNGYLAERGDFSALAAHAVELLRDGGTRAAFARRSRALAADFSIWRMQEQVEEVYRRVTRAAEPAGIL